MAAKSSERATIIGGRVRQAILDAGINNSELARRTGLPRRTIVRVANGHNEPDGHTLEQIAAGTGKTLDYFAVNGNSPSPRVVEALGDFYAVLLADLHETLTAKEETRA